MADIKPVPITKNLLTQLPPPVNEKPEADLDQRDAVIEELKVHVEALQQHVTFMASFEANLLRSFDAEIAILKEGALITQNEAQKRAFRSIADSLERIRDRWADGYQFYIDRKKMSITRRKVVDE